MKNSVRMLLWCLVLTPFGAPGFAGQDKPDFSGTWVLQDPRQHGLDIPRMLAIRQPLQRATVLGEPMAPTFLDLTVEKRFEKGMRVETYHIGTDGGTVRGIVGDRSDLPINRPSSRVSVRWEGDRLHIQTEHYSGLTRDSNSYIEHTEVWWLDEQDRLLITVVDKRSDSQLETRTLTYRRE